ncbi:hypothetical protein ACFE04_000931 [Oxalis oulophora]
MAAAAAVNSVYNVQINDYSKLNLFSKSLTTTTRRRSSSLSLSSIRYKTLLLSSSSRKDDTSPERVDSDSDSTQPDSFSLLIRRFREEGLKVDGLTMEIMSIALPAALAFAADPIASLVDTAFIGHIGSVELAAVGVSISVFNLVSKLLNVPLLNITTSFVAEEQALTSKENNDDSGKKVLPSVSTSLALAATIGILETVALSFGSGFLMNIMGNKVRRKVLAMRFFTKILTVYIPAIICG